MAKNLFTEVFCDQHYNSGLILREELCDSDVQELGHSDVVGL